MANTVLVGDRVRWENSRGTNRGEVVDIRHGLDAFGDDIVIVFIEQLNGKVAMIAEHSFDMIGFKVIFRDYDIQVARGEKVAA